MAIFEFEKFVRSKVYKRTRKPLNPSRLRKLLSGFELASDVVDYFVVIEEFPRVTVFDEPDYLNKVSNGDKEARHILIMSKLRNVRPIVLRWLNKGIDIWDMIQVGNMAVIEAIDNHASSRTPQLSTLINLRVNRALKLLLPLANADFSLSYYTYVLRSRKPIHIWQGKPRKEKWLPPDKRHCAYVGPVKMLRIRQEDLILDCDLAFDPSIQSFFSLVREELRSAIDQLSDREQKVLILRYGLLDDHQRTLKDVAKEFNIFLDRVRQIEIKALEKLKHPKRKERFQRYRELLWFAYQEESSTNQSELLKSQP